MKVRRALAGALVVLGALAATPARAATFTVEVGPGNVFAPQQVAIAVGDSVRWLVNDAGHTITANDERFDEEGLGAGGEFTWTFTEDETFFYRCKVHAEMFGVIEVGEGSPVPPPDAGPSEIRRVCRDGCDAGPYDSAHETITDALAGAPPRALIEVEPGTYDDPIVLGVTGLVLRGIGATPADVVIDAPVARLHAVRLFGDQTAVEHLTVRDAELFGVYASGADGFGVSDVVALDNDRAGVMVEAARGGVVRDSVARGSVAGFAAANCPSCDTVFERVLAEGNFTGFDGDDAGSLVVRDSEFTDNGTGITLRTTFVAGDSLDPDAPQRGSHILNNHIHGNGRLGGPAPVTSAQMPLRTGAGIWLNAGSFNLIERNTIAEHPTYGVAITGLVGLSGMNRIIANELTANAVADLAWDGLGIGTCFAGNGAASADPVFALAAYDCALPPTIGVPYPPVDVTVLDHGTI